MYIYGLSLAETKLMLFSLCYIILSLYFTEVQTDSLVFFTSLAQINYRWMGISLTRIRVIHSQSLSRILVIHTTPFTL